METCIEIFPSWAYMVVLVASFGVALGVADLGLKLCGTMLSRLRRLTPG